MAGRLSQCLLFDLIMLPDELLHTKDVIPTTEFLTTLVEGSHRGESHVLVEMLAVPGQIFVFPDGIRHVGIQIQNPLLLEIPLQCFVQRPAVAPALGLAV